MYNFGGWGWEILIVVIYKLPTLNTSIYCMVPALPLIISIQLIKKICLQKEVQTASFLFCSSDPIPLGRPSPMHTTTSQNYCSTPRTSCMIFVCLASYLETCSLAIFLLHVRQFYYTYFLIYKSRKVSFMYDSEHAH